MILLCVSEPGARRRGGTAAELLAAQAEIFSAPLPAGAWSLLAWGAGAAATAREAARRGAARAFWSALSPSRGEDSLAILSAVEVAVGRCRPELILFAASPRTRDLAPRLAARLRGAFLPEARALELSSGVWRCLRPVLTGRFLARLALLRLPAVLPLRDGPLPPEAPERGGVSEPVAVEEIGAETGRGALARLRSESVILEFRPADGASRPSQEGNRRAPPELGEAELVLCGGRGLGGREGFELLRQTAEALGGAPAASRAAVDAGWAPPAWQIGQSGRQVAPALYLACGVSGSYQHLAGMRESRCVAAVNTDPAAPIFQWTDYAWIGDACAALRALLEAARAEKGGGL